MFMTYNVLNTLNIYDYVKDYNAALILPGDECYVSSKLRLEFTINLNLNLLEYD